MSKATFTWGRFNPPTEAGHGKLVKAVQDHAKLTGGEHYVFPTHTQDKKKNPLTHSEKTSAMSKLFPKANVVSHDKVRTVIDAMKHLENKGHTEVTLVAGSDRVPEYQKLLGTYREKEFPKIKKVNVVSAGHRDPDAEGAEGMSASKLRGLAAAGKKDEFVSHYSDRKLGGQIHDMVKSRMQTESTNPIGIFLLGAPGSGKDYVLKNVFSHFNLTEVQADQLLNGSVSALAEQKTNLVINGISDSTKIAKIQDILQEHGYWYDFVHVSVSNKVSKLRNEQRENPLPESKRIAKFVHAEKLSELTEAFVFNNTINLNESSEMEKIFFANQIENLLERIVSLGLEMKNEEVWDKPIPRSKKQGKLSAKQKLKAKVRAKRAGRRYPNMVDNIWASRNEQVAHKISGTNCKNCVYWNKESEQKVDKSELNENGGLKAPNESYIKMAKHADLVTLPGKATVNMKAFCGHEDIQDFVTERMCCAYWDGKGVKREFKGKSDISEQNDINKVFEKVLELGTKETLDFAKSITPGQSKQIPEISKSFGCKCGGNCKCNANEAVVGNIETDPELDPKKPKLGTKTKFSKAPGFSAANPPAAPIFTGAMSGGYSESVSLEEAVDYHLQNNISLVENIFRPGSENFFELIKEAKQLYSEGKYTPKDEWEKDLLRSDIGELAEYQGQLVVLDYPVEEGLEEACWSGYTQKGMKKKGAKMVPNCVPVNEEDETGGKGIGKPWREEGGGAVYVRTGDGVRKVSFSKSGMTKKYNDPARVRSFVARHRCLTNTDKTSASYWACRWPRFFSNSGQKWW
jgi:dephospho-CoA kinase